MQASFDWSRPMVTRGFQSWFSKGTQESKICPSPRFAFVPRRNRARKPSALQSPYLERV